LNFNEQQIQIARNLASFAPVYQNTILELNLNVKKQFNNNFIALDFFLEHYAYERQGSPKAYPIIAKKTIEDVFHGKLEIVTSEQSTKAWKTYNDIASQHFNGMDTNEKLNPMNCEGGVLTVMANQETENMNIAGFVKKRIQNGKTKEAHKFIDSIRGIGTKIASFYLRDIAYLGGLNEKQIKDQFYLQPMDTWLEQAYTVIEGRQSVSLEAKQKTFVDLCEQAGCSPIEFNQGA
jgi:hypothetical protein